MKNNELPRTNITKEEAVINMIEIAKFLEDEGMDRMDVTIGGIHMAFQMKAEEDKGE